MTKHPFFVLIQEHDQGPDLVSVGGNKIKYDDLIAMGETDFEIVKPKDEGDPISVNFTSGSTGEPKGVLYSHKAAYLKSLASVRLCDMGIADASLTVPFKVRLIVAGVLPMSRVMKVEGLGYTVSHAYGMTEVLGPAIVKPWRSTNEHKKDNIVIGNVDVKEPETMESVRHDGKTIGEVMFKGNTLMLGSTLKTQKPYKKHLNMDGGEVISTLEVEPVLLSHPTVAEAAVVGKRDDYSKETPCAFVNLKEEYYYGAMSCQGIVEF
ncbi:hypothetical protein J1N35_006662 [Gossypium stocksii]|uniref:AMP-dependent synthetase/ligase domain-containing protein n=1 Tax=Gossypium stocksii TaxID=47602 RepID=A0A9D3W541_9ROSI|nr:hypothetical protein J1N35_006662 [Gossypium stocksii]